MQFLRAQDCADRLGISRKTWYDWWDSGLAFPEPVIKTAGYVVWLEEDVTAYQELLIRERRSGYVKPDDRKKKGVKAA